MFQAIFGRITLCFALLFTNNLYAQTGTGKVMDAQTGQPIEYPEIYLLKDKQIIHSVSGDSLGRFKIPKRLSFEATA